MIALEADGKTAGENTQAYTELLQLAFSLEKMSSHPLAEAIVKKSGSMLSSVPGGFRL